MFTEHHQYYNIQGILLGEARLGDVNHSMLAGSQGGRTWQLFVGSKNANENFRQARIYNFRVKCVVLRVIANLQN